MADSCGNANIALPHFFLGIRVFNHLIASTSVFFNQLIRRKFDSQLFELFNEIAWLQCLDMGRCQSGKTLLTWMASKN